MGVSMRRNKTHQRGRVRLLRKLQVRLILALIGCGAAYLIVGSRTVALRSADLSAAQTVALRFPANSATAPAERRVLGAAMGLAQTASHTVTHAATLPVDDVGSALFSPEPMMPQANPPQAPAQASAPGESDSAASAEMKVAVADTAAPPLS